MQHNLEQRREQSDKIELPDFTLLASEGPHRKYKV